MSSRRSIRATIRGAFVAFAAAVALLVVLPTAARAELNTPISGDTGSDSTVFYLSSVFRQITTDMYNSGQAGYVHINIDVAPKLGNGTPDGLKWRLWKQSCQCYTGVTYLNQDPSLWVNLGFVDYPGQNFRNSFTRTTSCPNCNHTFSGNMNY